MNSEPLCSGCKKPLTTARRLVTVQVRMPRARSDIDVKVWGWVCECGVTSRDGGNNLALIDGGKGDEEMPGV